MFGDLLEHFRLLLITQNHDYFRLTIGMRDLHAVYQSRVDGRCLVGVLENATVMLERKFDHYFHGSL
jgi:hypothetical protein